jgi:hypothetical protein
VTVAAPALACVNTFQSKILDYRKSGNDAGVSAEIGRLEFAFRENPGLAQTNDLAVGRMLTDRHAQAVELLEDAEKRFPGSAIVAANMGTAYELMGRDEDALRWIREGVRRDPAEHNGSEWLHVKILEAKLALKLDPRWLDTHTVLGVDFGSGELPIMPPSMPADETGKPRTVMAISEAIEYQLAERTTFVRPPDPIIADLYAARGDLAFASARAGARKVYIGDPGMLYAAALRYGTLDKSRVELRRQRFAAAYPGNQWIGQFETLPMR